MAGLVVIDFIDMENGSNVRKVEKAMKDALRNDRARIQVGRISSFGLMEMSRQRLRTGVLEATTRQCPHCDGTGLVRTASSRRPVGAAPDRGRGGARPRVAALLRASAGSGVLPAQPQARRTRRDRGSLRRHDRGRARRRAGGRRMSVEGSGPPPAHAPRFEAPHRGFRRGSSRGRGGVRGRGRGRDRAAARSARTWRTSGPAPG